MPENKAAVTKNRLLAIFCGQIRGARKDLGKFQRTFTTEAQRDFDTIESYFIFFSLFSVPLW
jgi:hypothetical protein